MKKIVEEEEGEEEDEEGDDDGMFDESPRFQELERTQSGRKTSIFKYYSNQQKSKGEFSRCHSMMESVTFMIRITVAGRIGELCDRSMGMRWKVFTSHLLLCYLKYFISYVN